MNEEIWPLALLFMHLRTGQHVTYI